MSNLCFNVIKGEKAVKGLLDQIELNSSNDVFQSTYWFRNLVDDNNISFTETDDDGKIQTALHIKITKGFGFKIAEMAGEPFSQYSDAVNNSGQPIDDFFEKSLAVLKASGVDCLHLHNVRADAHIIEYCKKHGEILSHTQAPWIDLTQYEDYQAYFDSTSKTTRKIYRKFFRDLDVETKYYIDDEISIELTSEIIQLKAAQLAKIGLTSRVFATEDNKRLAVQTFSTPTPDFITLIATCRVDGKLVAAAISHVKGDILYGYIIAMDVEYTKYSPGNSQVLLNIQWAFDHGIKVFDFLAPADDYKFKWTKDNYTAAYDILMPMSGKGKFYGTIYLQKMRPLLKSSYIYLKNSSLYKMFKK